ncbi:uncharacterized protein LOC101847069 [Aplysia californica]|uniref:Uncharacterized protein LOC101847069 n=1 Tax=Aplysia californica TaxID=6500 RepID=A0ABM0K6A6_APLCA|nr:uncharacterized protein LOC101847069 [Aplysia californica]
MEAFIGTWRHDVSKNENLDAFLKVLEVPDALLPALKKRQYTYKISKSGDNWTFEMSDENDPSLSPKTYTVKENQDYEVVDLDGVKYKVTMNMDGNKSTEKMTMHETGLVVNVSRVVEGNTMKAVHSCKGASMTAYFVRC